MMLLPMLVQAASAPPPASPPMPVNQAMWIGEEDYPIEALRNFWDGPVSFALDIDLQGAVTACTVTQTSGHSVLDAATCDLLKQRARFAPARTDRGLATAGRFSGHIRWVIPDREPAELAASSGRIEFAVDPQGRVHGCTSTMVEGLWPNLGDLCSHFREVSNIPPLRFQPAPNGSSRHVTIKFDLTVDEAP